MFKKLLLTGTVLLTTSFIATSSFASCVEYKIDPTHSQTGFDVDHSNLASMYVVFARTEGTICVDKKNPKNSWVKAKIYIDTVSYPPYKGFATHLKSSDYFNVKEFPLSTFDSTKVTQTGPNTLDVKGTLKFMGKSKEYILKTTMRGWGSYKNVEGFSYFATTKMDRNDYGLIKYGSKDNPNVTVRINGEAFLSDKSKQTN